MALRSFEAFKRKQLKDPKFKAAYDALEKEFALAAKKIEARETAAAKKKATVHTKKPPPPREKVEAPKTLKVGGTSKKKAPRDAMSR